MDLERHCLTPDVAIRLAHFLGTTPESWLNMQQALDVWELQRKNARIYEQIKKMTELGSIILIIIEPKKLLRVINSSRLYLQARPSLSHRLRHS